MTDLTVGSDGVLRVPNWFKPYRVSHEEMVEGPALRLLSEYQSVAAREVAEKWLHRFGAWKLTNAQKRDGGEWTTSEAEWLAEFEAHVNTLHREYMERKLAAELATEALWRSTWKHRIMRKADRATRTGESPHLEKDEAEAMLLAEALAIVQGD